MKKESVKQMASRRQRRRAFTLTEIAIVLGIIGLILGAIWAAASAVYENLKFSQAQQGITLAAQQVRSLFASSNNTGATGTVITAPGMLPSSWTSSGNKGNPWNQAPAEDMTYIYGDGSKFGIELDNIDPSGCASLANFYSSTAAGVNGGQIVGLAGVTVKAEAAPVGGLTGTIGGAAWAPTDAWNAATGCTGGSGLNAVLIEFNMNNM